MIDLEHSLAMRKGKNVAQDAFADTFEELLDHEKLDVYEDFVFDFLGTGYRSNSVMSHVPAEFFGDVADTYIRDEIPEAEIRYYAGEIGLDPEAPLEEIEVRVTSAIEDRRLRTMRRAAQKRDDVTYQGEGQYDQRFQEAPHSPC